MDISLTILISLITVCITIFNFFKANKKEIEKQTRLMTTLTIEVKRIGKDYVKLNDGYENLNDEVIKVKESTKSAHHRLDNIVLSKVVN